MNTDCSPRRQREKDEAPNRTFRQEAAVRLQGNAIRFRCRTASNSRSRFPSASASSPCSALARPPIHGHGRSVLPFCGSGCSARRPRSHPLPPIRDRSAASAELLPRGLPAAAASARPLPHRCGVLRRRSEDFSAGERAEGEETACSGFGQRRGGWRSIR